MQGPLALKTADGRQEQLRLTVDADGSRWSFGDTNYSGVYTATIGPPVARDETFCVNVDTAESDLARIDPGGASQTIHDQPAGEPRPAGRRQRQPPQWAAPHALVLRTRVAVPRNVLGLAIRTSDLNEKARVPFYEWCAAKLVAEMARR